MNIKWTERKLSDISTMIDYRGKTPQKSTSGIPLITAKIVKNGTILPANEFIAESQYASWMTRGYPCVGDVVMTTEAPLGEVAQLRDAHVALAQRIITIRGKKDVLDNGYLKYFLQSAEGQGRLRARETGTTVTGIKAAELRELMIPLPDIMQQRKISKVLLDLDEKIYNLTQENHNLEEQAKAIFKSWFVDFEPFGYKAPCTWESGILGDFVEIKRGGSPRPIQNYLSNSGLRWLKISDATACPSPFLIDIKEHIKESGLSKTVLLNTGALVLSNSATPGIPKILDVDSCIHDGWLYFPKSKLSNEFIFLFFKHIRSNLVSLGNGSVFTNLKTDILKAYPFILPDEQTLKAFNDLIFPVFERIKNNSREINSLAQLRDALLPKLMSGEIDVSEVQV